MTSKSDVSIQNSLYLQHHLSASKLTRGLRNIDKNLAPKAEMTNINELRLHKLSHNIVNFAHHIVIFECIALS